MRFPDRVNTHVSRREQEFIIITSISSSITSSSSSAYVQKYSWRLTAFQCHRLVTCLTWKFKRFVSIWFNMTGPNWSECFLEVLLFPFRECIQPKCTAARPCQCVIGRGGGHQPWGPLPPPPPPPAQEQENNFFIKCFIDTILVLLSRCMYFFEACLLMFSAVVHNFSTLHQLEYSLLLRKQYYAS